MSAVRSPELAETLATRTEALCAQLSPIGHERALCDVVEAWARGRFPAVERVGDSLVVQVDGARDPARPTVALCGHLDTVPLHDEDRRAPRREDGRIVAPGSSDMKGGLAVMMELAERLPRAERFCDLLLVLYAREEGPYAENELEEVLREPRRLRGVDLALCLEPTDNVLQLGCVGSIHATVTFAGKAAHSARPWQGANAVHRAGALLAELQGRAPREARSGDHVFREVLSATRIEGGRARNVVPDRCTLNLNFRFAPDRTLEDASAELRALAGRHGAEIELTDLSPACPAFQDHPHRAAPRRAHRRAGGAEAGVDRRRAARGPRHPRGEPRPRRDGAGPPAGRVDRGVRARAGLPDLRGVPPRGAPVTGALLALALAAAPALPQEEWETPPYESQDEEHVRHLLVSAWGGEAFDAGGAGRSYGTLGGEVAWAFDSLDLGLAGYGYRGLSDTRPWTPVGLVRLTQRFRMHTGVEATFGLGVGAAKPKDWEAWFQVALGVRIPLGPLFLGGELAFDRGDLIALRAALGLAF